MAWTKRTVAYITTHFLPKEFTKQIDSRLEQMIAEGKTDGIIVNFDSRSKCNIRRWRDEQAVQEWLDFILPLSAEYDIEITGYQVEDNDE